MLSLPYTHSRAFYITHIQVETCSCLPNSELVQTPCLWLVWLFITMGHSRTRSSLQGPLCDGIKLSISLKEKKKKKHMNGIHASSSKKKGRNERCLITTEDLHFHYTCTWPEWYTFSLPWDITIAPAKWMCKTCVTFTQAPHTPSEESRKQSEVWVRWVNEWSEQESPPWFYKIQKNLPSTAKQELATTLIDSFRRSMGKDDSVSHPESKVWRESFEITLMHTLSHEP